MLQTSQQVLETANGSSQGSSPYLLPHGLLSGELSYLLPHVDEEEFPGNVEGHVGIIGIVPKVGDGDV